MDQTITYTLTDKSGKLPEAELESCLRENAGILDAARKDAWNQSVRPTGRESLQKTNVPHSRQISTISQPCGVSISPIIRPSRKYGNEETLCSIQFKMRNLPCP
jgi:hypothetical protein